MCPHDLYALIFIDFHWFLPNNDQGTAGRKDYNQWEIKLYMVNLNLPKVRQKFAESPLKVRENITVILTGTFY